MQSLTSLAQEPPTGALFVEVREAMVRALPKPWAPVLQRYPYGTAVTVRRREPGWVVIQLPDGRDAFLSEASLTTKRIIFKPVSTDGTADQELSSKDVVLAGKGFSGAIEESYKSKERAPQYALLQSLEDRVVSDQEFERFVISGGLLRGVSR